jgi:cobalt-zinc-cadmium efflux system membrane fusion protein
VPIFLSRLPQALRTNAFIFILVILALSAGIAIERFLLTSPPATEPEHQEETSSRELKLTPERIRNADIGVLRVSQGSLANQIIAQATVAATPAGAAIIGARADGTVTEVRKRLGDAVRQGEILGTIQSREAARLAEDTNAAQARLVRAEQAFARQQNLLSSGATARQDYDAAQAELRVAQAEVARTRAANAATGVARDGVSLNILSPVPGRITVASAVLGAYVVAGTELFRVADPDLLEVQASVTSADAQRIAVGDRALIDLPQGAVDAIVRAITPDIGLQSRAATVVLAPSGNAGALKPGQLVSVRIIVAHGHSDAATILVPTAALQKIEGEDAVFIRSREGFRVQTIIPGARSGGMAEIRSGLKPGDEIATSNSFLLKAELQKGSGGHND